MSLDLFERETEERLARMTPLERPEPGAWDGFMRGSASFTMRGYAAAARGVSMAAAVGPILYDKITDGTEAQDRYFKDVHEATFDRAVDYWTPKPGEVGWAGQVTGTLLSLLPLVVASPTLAVATTQLSMAEDLIRKGVDPAKAQAVGAVYGTGIGLGILVPILGTTITQRMLLGGAGFNVAQGVSMRATAEQILKGTPAEGEFQPFGIHDLTLDVLLGLAFGGLAHISPAMRAQGEEFWSRVEAWRANLTPDQIAALAALRAAQHASADSLPGRPTTADAGEAHVARVRAAVEQLATDRPVSITDLPPPRFAPDPARATDAGRTLDDLRAEAERVRIEEGLPHPPDIAAEYGHAILPPRTPTGEVAEAVPSLSPLYQEIDRVPVAELGGNKEGQLQELRRRLFEARQDPEAAVREMWGSDLADAPPRLQQAIIRGLAVRQMPPSAPQVPRGAFARPRIFDLTALPAEKQPTAIAKAVEDALARINLAPEEAQANATLWESFFRTAAERHAIPAAAILEPYGVDIRRLGELEDLPGALAQKPLPEGVTTDRRQNAIQRLEEAKTRAEVARTEAKQARADLSALQAENAPAETIRAATERWKVARETVGRHELDTRQLRDQLERERVAEKRVLFQPLLKALGQRRFYSELGRQIAEVKQESATPEHWKGIIKNFRGVKRDEVQWSGLEEWLDLQAKDARWKNAKWQEPTAGYLGDIVDDQGRPLSGLVTSDEARALIRSMKEDAQKATRVTKQQIQDFLAGNAVRVEEVLLGERAPERVERDPVLTDLEDRLSNLGFSYAPDMEMDVLRFTPEDINHPLRGIPMTIDEMRAETRIPRTVIEIAQQIDQELQRAPAGWEMVEGIPRGATKFGQYQLPGGENYREFFITLPHMKESWSDGHAGYEDIRNPLVRLRFNERTDAEGKRVLFFEEMQPPLKAEQAKMPQMFASPKVYVALGLKRMIAWAVENGFDRVAWTTGEQQVTRYTSALRKAVDEIQWKKTEEGVHLIGYKGKGADQPGARERELLRRSAIEELPPERVRELERLKDERRQARNKVVDTTQKEDVLSDAIGKAMAKRILDDPAQEGSISGESIHIDDPGMAAFYDRILPNVANDILKKLGGGKVGEVQIDIPAHTPFGAAEQPMRLEGAVGRDPPDFDVIQEGLMRQGFAGLTDFSDAEPPLYAEGSVRLGGPFAGITAEGAMLIDPSGFHFVAADGSFEFMIDIPPLAARSQDAAHDFVMRNWNKPGFWMAMEMIQGEPPKTIKPEAAKQMGFDITPEMRERVPKGLPLFQPGRGQIQFGDRQTVIGLFENADRSTFLHETGHFFLEVTRDLSRRPTAPEGARGDWDTLAKWLKISPEGEITTEAHEKFARGWERYMAEGKAPSEGLKAVFEQFKRWLLEIYHSLTDMDVTLSRDVRAVMDRMLAPGKPERPAGQAPRAGFPPPPRPEAQPAGRAGPEPSRLMRDIRELGGIDQRYFEDVTGEKRFGKVKGLPWGVFRPAERGPGGTAMRGLGLDDMARQLRERGWDIPEENEVAALTQMLDSEIRGARGVRLGEEAEVMTSARMMLDMDELNAQFTEAETAAAEQFGFNDRDPRYIEAIQRIRQDRDAAMAEIMKQSEDPIQAEAARTAHQKPNLKIRVGEDEQGRPVTVSARQYLEDASRATELANKDSELFRAAAACLGGAA